MECGRATNNLFPGCPPLMADGRAFTDYRPKGVQALQDVVPLNKGSYELRQHMEAHATDMIARRRAHTYAENVCGPCKEPYERGTLLSEHSSETCGVNACRFELADANGLGLGREFGGFDGADQAYARFLEDKRLEQAGMAQTPCARAFDPFLEFPMRSERRDGARLVSPAGLHPV